MLLHILGRNAGCSGPNGGCSGYLVEIGEKRLLLDCGPGILGRLQAVCRLEDLDAIWLSHLHADHFLDVIPLAYGLMARCMTLQASYHIKQIPLFLPRGTKHILTALSRILGHPDWRFMPVAGAAQVYEEFLQVISGQEDFVFGLLPTVEYDLNGCLDILGTPVSMRSVNHGVPASAILLEFDGLSFVYSGDTAYCPQLIELAHGADVLLCEATTTPDDSSFYAYHMSAFEAGRVASEAQVKQLILTHLSPWVDEAFVLQEAGKAFSGEILLAQEGNTVELKALPGNKSSSERKEPLEYFTT